MLKQNKILNHIIEQIKPLFLATVALSLASCTEAVNPDGEHESEPIYGVTGKIFSSIGEPLPGARLYCLYDQNWVPSDGTFERALEKTARDQSFGFELFQNTPNPLSNSVYFRFSVPEECSVKLQIVYGPTNSVAEIFEETVTYGLYQRFCSRLVENQQMKNGLYQCLLSGVGKSGAVYQTQSTLFVISTLGSPNATTASDGQYVFNIGEAFVGDSIVVKRTEEVPVTRHLGSTVFMLVVEDGYTSKIVELPLVENLLFHQDIILEKVSP